jgi:hypothetical protein
MKLLERVIFGNPLTETSRFSAASPPRAWTSPIRPAACIWRAPRRRLDTAGNLRSGVIVAFPAGQRVAPT